MSGIPEAHRCPRCGLDGELVEKVINGRVYYYMRHYLGKEGGRSKVKWCYLGPAEYDYVTRTHAREMLILRGMIDEDRVLYYLRAAAALVAARLRGCAGLEGRLAEVLRMSEEVRGALSAAADPREKAVLEKDVESIDREREELEEGARKCHEARVAAAEALALLTRLASEDRKLAELVARRSGERTGATG